jgi:hypothetical protein
MRRAHRVSLETPGEVTDARRKGPRTNATTADAYNRVLSIAEFSKHCTHSLIDPIIVPSEPEPTEIAGLLAPDVRYWKSTPRLRGSRCLILNW